MGMLELVMVGIIGWMMHLMVTKVWFNYQIVGQALDVLGIPGVQDRLFSNVRQTEMIQRVADRFLFLTKIFPFIVLAVLVVCGALYFSLKGSVVSGEAVATEWVVFCSLVIGAWMTWLITFDPTPEWLYESHVIVLLAKSVIELELIQSALKDVEDKVSDELSEEEAALIKMQCIMLSELASDIEATVKDLEQQKREIRS